MDQHAQRIKIITVGDPSVGKSCVIKRYCEKRFISKYLPTIGIDYGATKTLVGQYALKVNIFDMAGHKVFAEVRNEFYESVHGVLLFYDVSQRSSFEALDDWWSEMMSANFLNGAICFLCGSKIDLYRAVDTAEAMLWADCHGCFFFEISAKTGKGIVELFEKVFSSIVESISSGTGMLPNRDGSSHEQLKAIDMIRKGKTDLQKLGLAVGAAKEDINKAYKKLAMLIHPDKCTFPGCDAAFKVLGAARSSLLSS